MTGKDLLRLVRLSNERAEPEIERLRSLIERAGYGTGQKEAQRISGTSQRSRVECNVCAKIDLENEIIYLDDVIAMLENPEVEE